MAFFEHSFTVSRPTSVVWEFLSDVNNIARCTPPEAKIDILEAPGSIAVGERFRFRVRAFGQSREALHEIVEVTPGSVFVENQVEGPAKSWVHRHAVESLGDSDSRVLDQIEFEPPGGLAGLLVTETVIRKGLERVFAHREREMTRLLTEM